MPCKLPALRAPFPYFGGKMRVALPVWERFGDVANYVEPFAGSLAVLLGRPTAPRIETVNDKDCFIANFWRALKAEPQALAELVDWPVNEADLHARHTWLVGHRPERVKGDPDFYDLKTAAWWVWGICQWIGSGWCQDKVGTQLPQLGHLGMSVHKSTLASSKLPRIGDTGSGFQSQTSPPTAGWFLELSERLRLVRVACGDWDRILKNSVLFPSRGNTHPSAVFLDPPYLLSAGRTDGIYAADSSVVAEEVRRWAIEHGANPRLRIALCGYEGEHVMPKDWECLPWKSKGGYGSQSNGGGRTNSSRERIWFSPHCLKVAA